MPREGSSRFWDVVAERLEGRDVEDAGLVGSNPSERPSRTSSSIPQRKAASVFPDRSARRSACGAPSGSRASPLLGANGPAGNGARPGADGRFEVDERHGGTKSMPPRHDLPATGPELLGAGGRGQRRSLCLEFSSDSSTWLRLGDRDLPSGYPIPAPEWKMRPSVVETSSATLAALPPDVVDLNAPTRDLDRVIVPGLVPFLPGDRVPRDRFATMYSTSVIGAFASIDSKRMHWMTTARNDRFAEVMDRPIVTPSTTCGAVTWTSKPSEGLVAAASSWLRAGTAARRRCQCEDARADHETFLVVDRP